MGTDGRGFGSSRAEHPLLSVYSVQFDEGLGYRKFVHVRCAPIVVKNSS